MSHSLEGIPFDAIGNDIEKASRHTKGNQNLSSVGHVIKSHKKNRIRYVEKTQSDHHKTNVHFLVEAEPLKPSVCITTPGDLTESSEASWTVAKKSHRKRSKTLSQSEDHQQVAAERRLAATKSSSHSDTEINDGNLSSKPNNTLLQSIVVVVDNSNIFIGARETVCNTHAQIKPKHVKLRLQQLLSVAENKRKVSRGFTAGSSPPVSDHVWDIYRLDLHGYTTL